MYAYYWYVLREMDMYCMCNDIKDILYKWVARTRQLCSFVWLLKNALKNLYMLVKLTPGFTQIGYISTTAKPFSDWPATHTHTHTQLIEPFSVARLLCLTRTGDAWFLFFSALSDRFLAWKGNRDCHTYVICLKVTKLSEWNWARSICMSCCTQRLATDWSLCIHNTKTQGLQQNGFISVK